jgi:hypothetical protein
MPVVLAAARFDQLDMHAFGVCAPRELAIERKFGDSGGQGDLLIGHGGKRSKKRGLEK